MNTENNNIPQNERKSFWGSNTWAIVIAATGGVITLYFEYNYFQKNAQMNKELDINFSALDNLLGYLFAGIFFFFILFLLLSLFVLFSSFEEGLSVFGLFLFLSIFFGVIISVSAQLGLKSTQKSIIIIDNIYNQIKNTKTGKKIVRKLDKLNIQPRDDKFDYSVKLDGYINTVDSNLKVSKFVSFYFFNLSEIKTYMLNNGFQVREKYRIEDVTDYDTEYKGNIFTYFLPSDSLICRYYYNNSNDSIDKILLFTQSVEVFKNLKNSILADSCYRHEHSSINADEYSYNKFIASNPDSDYDENWIFEAEIRFDDEIAYYFKDKIAGKHNYFILLTDFYPANVYGDKEFGFFKNEGRKRYLESVK